MSVLGLTVVVWLSSLAAGFLGSLTGLGGGFVIVPMLTLVFGVDLRYAIGASLVSVIATSCGAGAAFVREGYANVRLGMFLEVATTLGALAGAFVAPRIGTSAIAIVFGLMLMFSAAVSHRRREGGITHEPPDPLATRLRLNGGYPTADGDVPYNVYRIPAGFALMGLAGVLSALLGIGSGALKVLAMDQTMRVPFKVSTTTSNFMIGVTAAASAGIYLRRGYLDPGLAMPVVLGVLPGALLGARLLAGAKTGMLRAIFTLVLLLVAAEMIYNGIMGRM